ncbi:hypothetical protein D3C83_66780 [compost metagenome]
MTVDAIAMVRPSGAESRRLFQARDISSPGMFATSSRGPPAASAMATSVRATTSLAAPGFDPTIRRVAASGRRTIAIRSIRRGR